MGGGGWEEAKVHGRPDGTAMSPGEEGERECVGRRWPDWIVGQNRSSGPGCPGRGRRCVRGVQGRGCGEAEGSQGPSRPWEGGSKPETPGDPDAPPTEAQPTSLLRRRFPSPQGRGHLWALEAGVTGQVSRGRSVGPKGRRTPAAQHVPGGTSPPGLSGPGDRVGLPLYGSRPTGGLRRPAPGLGAPGGEERGSAH